MANQYEEILIQLLSGESVAVDFPTPQDQSRFRAMMYHEKRKMDEIMIVMDDGFEVGRLEVDRFPNSNRLKFRLVQKAARAVKFTIVQEDE